MRELIPLAVFVASSTFTPGGQTTLMTATGAQFGFLRSIPLILGVAVGLASMAGGTALGLGSILLAASSLQLLMKAAGSLYLLWLSWKIARSGPPRLRAHSDRPAGLISGVWMVWHNPKGWAMTLGAAASFSSLEKSPGKLALLLAAAFGCAAILSLIIWCSGGLLLSRLIKTDRQWTVLNRCLGALLTLSILFVWV
jgi:threonine/homoserine/homoserine lactone efflux protein